MTAVEERRDVAENDGREDDVVIAAMEPGTEAAPDAGASDKGVSNDAVAARPADIRVLSGSPTDEDIAALATVISAVAAAVAPAAPSGPLDNWGRPATMHRTAAPFSPYSFTAGRS